MAASRPDKLGPDLSAYLDGELPEARAREIERLLAESPECRAALELLRGTSRQLASLPSLRAPAELAAALRRSAERRALLGDVPPTRRGRTLRRLVPLTAAAAIFVGGIVVGWQMLGRARPAARHETLVLRDESRPPEVGMRFHTEMPPGVPAGAREQPGKAVDAKETSAAEYARFRRSDAPPGVPPSPAVVTDADEVAALPPPAGDGAWKAAGNAGLGPAQADVSGRAAGELATEPAWPQFTFGAAQSLHMPTVDVVITPQNQEQYVAARAVMAGAVTLAQGEETEGGGQQMWLGAARGGLTPPRVELVGRLPATELAPLVAALNQQVPNQVACAVNVSAANLTILEDLGRATAVQTTEEHLAADQVISGDVLAGGAGGAQPGSQPVDATALAEPDAERVTRAAPADEARPSRGLKGDAGVPAAKARAGRGRGAPEPSQSGTGAEAHGAAQAQRRESPPAEQNAPSQSAARGGRVGGGPAVRKVQRAPQTPATHATAPQDRIAWEGKADADADDASPLQADEAGSRVLRAQAAELLNSIAARLERLAQALSAPDGQAVTVRVTLLPPPAAPAASAPAPPGAEPPADADRPDPP